MKLIKAVIILVFSGLLLIITNYYLVSTFSNPKLYNDLEKVPFNQVGLLLGTSSKNRQGLTNKYFKERINAAVELYKNNKINFIIVSGDNSTLRYNEPEEMKKALIKNNIPEKAIYTDYAGFSTIDSVLRANKIFGQESFTVISQEFHNQRAVFIAKKYNINAIGYNAKTITNSNPNILFREFLARIKARIEVFFKRNPKFLGEPIQITSKYDYQI
jgi:SanA protein